MRLSLGRMRSVFSRENPCVIATMYRSSSLPRMISPTRRSLRPSMAARSSRRARFGDVVPATAEMEEAMSMIANEMLSIRQDEEKEVFELLLRRKAGLDKDGEGEETQEMQEETQEMQETQETLPPSQSID